MGLVVKTKITLGLEEKSVQCAPLYPQRTARNLDSEATTAQKMERWRDHQVMLSLKLDFKKLPNLVWNEGAKVQKL